MPWEMWLIIGFYAFGWLVYIVAFGAQDALDGAVAIFTGILWPLFALGKLVSLL